MADMSERDEKRKADDDAFAEYLSDVADSVVSTPASHIRAFTGKTIQRLTEALEKGTVDPALEADLESYEAELLDALEIGP